MAIKGYRVDKDFFSGEPKECAVTFFLTDGGRTATYTPIMRIKDVYVSIDMDNEFAFIVVPKAYGSPFMRKIDLKSQIGTLHEFFDDVKEWLGLTQTWRQVAHPDKQCTVITICDGEIDTIDVLKNEHQ